MNVKQLLLFAVAGGTMFAGVTMFRVAPLLAQDGLPTLTEAKEISQQTGRPILAMAGQKT